MAAFQEDYHQSSQGEAVQIGGSIWRVEGHQITQICRKTTSASAAFRPFVWLSVIGNWGVFTAFQTLESFQSSDALKGQKASKCAPDLPSWKRYMDRGGKVKQQYKKH